MVFALFAAVRNNLASVAVLRRLCIVAIVNGALLSLFGLVQFCTSPRDNLYWRIAVTNGAVFGPFVNRDHFAFYINLCIGLGLGLLLSLRESRPKLREGGFFTFLGPSGIPVDPGRAGLDVCRRTVLSVAGRFRFAPGTGVICTLLAMRRSLRFGAMRNGAAHGDRVGSRGLSGL